MSKNITNPHDAIFISQLDTLFESNFENIGKKTQKGEYVFSIKKNNYGIFSIENTTTLFNTFFGKKVSPQQQPDEATAIEELSKWFTSNEGRLTYLHLDKKKIVKFHEGLKGLQERFNAVTKDKPGYQETATKLNNLVTMIWRKRQIQTYDNEQNFGYLKVGKKALQEALEKAEKEHAPIAIVTETKRSENEALPPFPILICPNGEIFEADLTAPLGKGSYKTVVAAYEFFSKEAVVYATELKKEEGQDDDSTCSQEIAMLRQLKRQGKQEVAVTLRTEDIAFSECVVCGKNSSQPVETKEIKKTYVHMIFPRALGTLEKFIEENQFKPTLTFKGKQFPKEIKKSLLDQILNAISHLHTGEVKIGNSDIKPENFLLFLTKNNSIKVKMGDAGSFYEVKQQVDKVEQESNSSMTLVFASPHYVKASLATVEHIEIIKVELEQVRKSLEILRDEKSNSTEKKVANTLLNTYLSKFSNTNILNEMEVESEKNLNKLLQTYQQAVDTAQYQCTVARNDPAKNSQENTTKAADALHAAQERLEKAKSIQAVYNNDKKNPTIAVDSSVRATKGSFQETIKAADQLIAKIESILMLDRMLENEAKEDRASNMWALGCTLYKLACERNLLEDLGYTETENQELIEKAKAIDALYEGLTQKKLNGLIDQHIHNNEEAKRVIKQLLKINPIERGIFLTGEAKAQVYNPPSPLARTATQKKINTADTPPPLHRAVSDATASDATR